ncbi:ribose 5-phosphate isomerase A [Sphingobacterium sp. UGAL515B_05]|jgi:ribose 5-phosphate isomerase A|uniref:ribose 5-phosphate isomerase A n=1 Tax=Sphingobacterium sp. UGAL515B_05 TaxID=2986767 RepID=UPI002954A204|nr:ribose 5-phosphate isomerase A [Sphingobacterium sp. UGAL515B_05]WON93925.1 ribose 5-phosphate isomerase A [Sphingobacterium sp. UGAL515B_05]
MRNLKQEVARAALHLLEPHQVIGLGVGSTIAHFVDLIATEIEFKSDLKFISPSLETKILLHTHGLICIDCNTLSALDYYFDSCDQVDQNLNALKSGGGVHCSEKIMAAMADQFILLVDATKMVKELSTTYPLCIEILPEAWLSVCNKIKSSFGPQLSEIVLRHSKQKSGPLTSDRGNFLADIYFNTLPDLEHLNRDIKQIPGVLEHSLFYQLCSECLMATDNEIKHLHSKRVD